jgi:transglutaminase superfamily protein
MLLFELWFAVRLGFWLCLLPIFLRVRSLPILLQHLTPVREQQKRRSSLETDRVVRIVVRLCQMRLFYLPIFPRACLRQALALYYVLTRMGYPIEIHFGVLKDKKNFNGHSWVTLQGEAVADTARSGVFKVVYSYPSDRSVFVSSNRRETERSKNEPIFNQA